VTFLHDAGAYGAGVIVPWITSTTIPGPYKIPNFYVQARLVYTNKTPASVVRGAGRPEAVFVMERMVERIAQTLGMDRAEVRKRNMIQPQEQPYDAGLIFRDNRPMIYDGGDYPAALSRALDLAGYASFEEYRAQAAGEGRLVGLGMAAYVEGTGLGPFEGATVRLESDGKVVVFVGTLPQGQGHHTVFSQICADQLGVSLDDVLILTGDTAALPKGIGTFGSRSTVVGGSAVHLAAGQVRERVVQTAAGLLRVHAGQLDIAGGEVYVKDEPDRRLPLRAVAQAVLSGGFGYASDVEGDPVIEATVYFRPDKASYSCGAAAAIVEADPETGFCRVERYVTVDDSAKSVNPAIVHAQIVGGVAHGIGNAMYEEVRYDELGQPINASFMDYLLPTAMEVP
ncbi:MAG: molybdopterin-dependent oxidoreductase, partial [Chloroflexota bacterium]|nr:molybdopterin-dependent oxidoreductase [Chloroflexota bacterium]